MWVWARNLYQSRCRYSGQGSVRAQGWWGAFIDAHQFEVVCGAPGVAQYQVNAPGTRGSQGMAGSRTWAKRRAVSSVTPLGTLPMVGGEEKEAARTPEVR